MADYKKHTFAENLEQLIELFGKLKERSLSQKVPGINKAFFKNFDYIAQNYKTLKKDIPDEVLERFGEPIQVMVEEMVEQLIGELEEDEYMDVEAKDLSNDLKEVDLLLRNPAISQLEMDQLLDQRLKISRSLQKKKMVRSI